MDQITNHILTSDSVWEALEDDKNKNEAWEVQRRDQHFANNWMCGSESDMLFFQPSPEEHYDQKYEDFKLCLKECGRSSDNAWQLYGYDE